MSSSVDTSRLLEFGDARGPGSCVSREKTNSSLRSRASEIALTVLRASASFLAAGHGGPVRPGLGRPLRPFAFKDALCGGALPLAFLVPLPPTRNRGEPSGRGARGWERRAGCDITLPRGARSSPCPKTVLRDRPPGKGGRSHFSDTIPFDSIGHYPLGTSNNTRFRRFLP